MAPTSCTWRPTTCSWPSSAPLTAASYRERGYTVTEVDMSEFEKLEGCVTCLSVRIRG